MDTLNQSNCVVRVRNLYKGFLNEPPIIQNFSMNVKKGTIYGLIGSSGCGKTTILSCVVGLAKWNSGEVLVFGQKPGLNSNGTAGKRLGYMPQELAICGLLTVLEVIRFYGRIYNLMHSEIIIQSKKLSNLLELPNNNKYVGELSGGQKRRVSLALALLHSPDLLVLDEPTVGLDPLLRDKIWNHLVQMVNSLGSTIIITTHYTEEARFTNTIGLVRNGKMLIEDTPSRLLQICQCDLLEEAVLKLCRGDESDKIVVSNHANNIWCETTDEILFPLQAKHDTRLRQSLQRIYGMSSVNFSILTRYPLFFILVMVIPSTQAIIYILIIGRMPREIHLGIINNEIVNCTKECELPKLPERYCEYSQLSCKFLHELTRDDVVKMESYNTVNEALANVQSGKLMGYLTIPSNYSQSLADLAMAKQFALSEAIDGSRITFRLDLSQYISGRFIIHYLMRSYFVYVQKLSMSSNITEYMGMSMLNFRRPVYGNNEDGYMDFMMPGIVILVLTGVSSGVTAIMLIYDRKQGIFRRQLAAGITSSDLMSSHLLVQAFLTICQIFILGGVLKFAFGYVILGPVWLCLIICILSGICGTVFGILMGITCNEEVEILLLQIFFYPILIMLGGVVWPAENNSIVIQYIRYVLPNSLVTDSLRSVIVRGLEIFHPLVWPGLIVLIAWILAAAICCLVAYRIFCKYERLF